MQITLPDHTVVYDLYERTIAASKSDFATTFTTQAITSILPRSVAERVIHFADVLANAGGTLDIRDSYGTFMTLSPDGIDRKSAGGNVNNVPLVGVKLQATVDSAVVDLDFIVA